MTVSSPTCNQAKKRLLRQVRIPQRYLQVGMAQRETQQHTHAFLAPPNKKSHPMLSHRMALNPPGTHLREHRVGSVEQLFLSGTGQGLHAGRTALDHGGHVVEVAGADFLLTRAPAPSRCSASCLLRGRKRGQTGRCGIHKPFGKIDHWRRIFTLAGGSSFICHQTSICKFSVEPFIS